MCNLLRCTLNIRTDNQPPRELLCQVLDGLVRSVSKMFRVAHLSMSKRSPPPSTLTPRGSAGIYIFEGPVKPFVPALADPNIRASLHYSHSRPFRPAGQRCARINVLVRS